MFALVNEIETLASSGWGSKRRSSTGLCGFARIVECSARRVWIGARERDFKAEENEEATFYYYFKIFGAQSFKRLRVGNLLKYVLPYKLFFL